MEEDIRNLRIAPLLVEFSLLGFSGLIQALLWLPNCHLFSLAMVVLDPHQALWPDGFCAFYKTIHGPLSQTLILCHPLTIQTTFHEQQLFQGCFGTWPYHLTQTIPLPGEVYPCGLKSPIYLWSCSFPQLPPRLWEVLGRFLVGRAACQPCLYTSNS